MSLRVYRRWVDAVPPGVFMYLECDPGKVSHFIFGPHDDKVSVVKDGRLGWASQHEAHSVPGDVNWLEEL